MSETMPMGPQTLRRYRTWFMIYGGLLVVLGVTAIALPYLATLAASLFVGWLLLVAGAFGMFAAFSAGQSAAGFWWHLFIAFLYLLAGLVMLFSPVAGMFTLTILLVAYLLAGGVSKFILALGYRSTIPRAWLWVLLSGLVDIALAVIIMMGFPGTALWVIGLLVGINLLFMGISLMVAAYHCRDLSPDLTRTA